MEVPSSYKFRYRLLASADVVGSTAFKVGQANKNEHWAPLFRDFFAEFPEAVIEEFRKVPNDLVPCGKPSKTFQVWKFVGDEVLFSVELERHEHTAIHILAFKNAIHQYSHKLSKKHKALALKGTIWGADFPVLNVEVETAVLGGSAKVVDYLGPSVDLGFRLAQFADRRKIPISADVALFLSSCLSHPKVSKALKLLAEPPRQLKGVNENIPYPLISIDRLDGEKTAEDKLLQRDISCRLDSLVEYLGEQFSGESDGPLRHPFIEGDRSDKFGIIPQESVDARDRMLAEDPYIAYERDANQADPTNAVTTLPPLPKVKRQAKLVKKSLKKTPAKSPRRTRK